MQLQNVTWLFQNDAILIGPDLYVAQSFSAGGHQHVCTPQCNRTSSKETRWIACTHVCTVASQLPCVTGATALFSGAEKSLLYTSNLTQASAAPVIFPLSGNRHDAAGLT